MSKRTKRIKTPLDLNDPFQAYLSFQPQWLGMWKDIPEESKPEYVKQAYELVEWFKTVQYEITAEVGSNGYYVGIRARIGQEEYPLGHIDYVPRNDSISRLIIRFVKKFYDDRFTVTILKIVNFRYKTQEYRWNPELPLIEFANMQVPRIAVDIQKAYETTARSEEARQLRTKEDIKQKQQQFQNLTHGFVEIIKNYDMFSMEEYIEAWNMALVQSIHD